LKHVRNTGTAKLPAQTFATRKRITKNAPQAGLSQMQVQKYQEQYQNSLFYIKIP